MVADDRRIYLTRPMQHFKQLVLLQAPCGARYRARRAKKMGIGLDPTGFSIKENRTDIQGFIFLCPLLEGLILLLGTRQIPMGSGKKSQR